MATWLLWAPLGAAVVHIFEEFVLPGGFMTWYRRYRGPSVASITPRLLIIMNVLLLAVCTNAAFAGDTAFGTTYWIAISAILASNGLWHVLGRSQRARLLSRHGYRNAALCSTCDLWLHSLPEVWFCSDWKRRHRSVDRRIVSTVVCALSCSDQEFRLIGGVSDRPAAVPDLVLNLLCTIDERGYLKLGLTVGSG